jgi:hypothetical protein
MKRNFAAFILSHGRADSLLTYDALRSSGYTGKIYILVDNEDSQADQYIEKYGDEVIVFDKTSFSNQVDACDNYDRRNSIVYARNYNFILAKEMRLTHFLQLDDDYTDFTWRLNDKDEYIWKVEETQIKNIDAVFEHCLDFLDSTSFKSVAFAQGGDFIGGDGGPDTPHQKSLLMKLHRSGRMYRKVMNSFFFRTDRPVVFRGRVNDDVNLYVEGGRRGDLFATIPHVRVYQPPTQKRTGGCTEIYLELGTYIKSFYSVMVAPSCVKVARMAGKWRIHHKVIWKKTCPVLLSEKYRKGIQP